MKHNFYRSVPVVALTASIVVFSIFWVGKPLRLCAGQIAAPPELIGPGDALLVVGEGGHIICKQNETRKCAPASTLKILTALAAIETLGENYRFETLFYQSREQELEVKGCGDPMLTSEVLESLADTLSTRVNHVAGLVIDDSYFANDINVPGVEDSTNPYDARNGALCANFNTVFFRRDATGGIVSAEPQTPMIPYVEEKIRLMGLRPGRHTLFRDHNEIGRYAGELLLHFLRTRGVECQGTVRMGVVRDDDRLVYAYRSILTLEETLVKMLAYSSNFMANQILITMGAHVDAPPGTLKKGVRVVSDFARDALELPDIEIAEGSGISRENRLSALDMLAILKGFEPYRTLLPHDGRVFYKSGSLKGIQARVGYVEGGSKGLYYFVVLLSSAEPKMSRVMDFVEHLTLGEG
jgi:D-alanyl-D-alanine carboxypeptidase/D-alanyl-D-alanine-endopeptidase (penicillin-binding protein 4)